MSIQEILEAHDGVLTPMMHEDYVLRCVCGHELHGLQAESHRAHLAEVLDKHMQEREAEAWDMGQDSVALHHDIFGASLEYEANPYRMETPNGR